MKISKLISSATPEMIKRPIRRFLAPIRLRNSWIKRSSVGGDNHLLTYWNAVDQPNRKLLIEIIYRETNELLNKNKTVSILEYGSHVGLNLKLLGDQYADTANISFFSVEPNKEAVEFLRGHLNFVTVLEAEDEKFCQNINFPPRFRVYLSFINSVFYCMDPRRVRNVLEKLTKFSNTIIIGESLKNIDGTRSMLRDNPECFEHPYRKYLGDFGFEIISITPAPDPKPQLNGYIVARKIHN